MCNRLTILDGGMGHELKLRGITDGTFLAGVLANQNSAPNNTVESIHWDYLDAGCDVITTNSFVAVPQRMVECGLATDEAGSIQRASTLIKASVDRARSAVTKYNLKNKHKKLIAGCVPPLTDCYFANKVPTSLNDLLPEYNVIISTLFDCEVDILLAETLSTTREAVAILRSLSCISMQTKGTSIPLWVSFTVHDDRHTKLRSNESLETACKTVIKEANSLNLPLAAIGINCSTPSAISNAIPILTNMVKGTKIRVSAYGNCFRTTTSEWIKSLENEAQEGEASCTTDITKQTKPIAEEFDDEGYMLPDTYAKYTQQWVESGASIVGGCCGSRPKHMKQVSSVLRKG